MKTIIHFPKLQKRSGSFISLKTSQQIAIRIGLIQRAFQISGVAISSLGAKTANVSRRICYAMATLHAKMNQTRTIVNALPASFAVMGEHASLQQLCVMEKTTALTEMTKVIAVSNLFLIGV